MKNGRAESEVKFCYWTLIFCSVFKTGANFQTQFSDTLRESGALRSHKEGVYNTTASTHSRNHFFHSTKGLKVIVYLSI